MRIDGRQGFEEFEKECLSRSLENGRPRKGEEFFLFRGASEPFELLNSLQVDLRERAKKTNWQEEINSHEKILLERFLTDILTFRELQDQYGWLCAPQPPTDTFWYLSVMQHFRAPTRLCDFTADFWMAIFFAADEANGSKDLGFYRLRCKNCEKTGNKLPRDRQGQPWSRTNSRTRETRYDMNEFLGYLIEYGKLAPNADDRERLAGFFHSEPKINFIWLGQTSFRECAIGKAKRLFCLQCRH
jgi:hypothetical protein